jgi:hypothetical protein
MLDWLPGYIITSNGRVFGPRGEMTWKYNEDDPDAYIMVGPRYEGGQRWFRMNRLVCEAFHGPPPSPDHVAAHLNGFKQDNFDWNLEWKTQAQNFLDQVSAGRTGMATPGRKRSEETIVKMKMYASSRPQSHNDAIKKARNR